MKTINVNLSSFSQNLLLNPVFLAQSGSTLDCDALVRKRSHSVQEKSTLRIIKVIICRLFKAAISLGFIDRWEIVMLFAFGCQWEVQHVMSLL